MRENWRKKFLSAMVFLAALLCLGSIAFAKNVYTAIPLAQNKTVVQRETDYKYDSNYNLETSTYYRYKITIPADGYITLTASKGEKNFSIDICMYKKLNTDKYLYDFWKSDVNSASVKIPISKGTYYLEGNIGNTFKYKFTKAAQKANYCPAKAQTLKKGAKVTICQTPNYNYSRWYKIKLTKSQAVTIWSDQGSRVAIFDEDFTESYNMERAGSQSPKYYTQKKLAKGTYYICMKRNQYHYTGTSYLESYYYTTLYWK